MNSDEVIVESLSAAPSNDDDRKVILFMHRTTTLGSLTSENGDNLIGELIKLGWDVLAAQDIKVEVGGVGAPNGHAMYCYENGI